MEFKYILFRKLTFCRLMLSLCENENEKKLHASFLTRIIYLLKENIMNYDRQNNNNNNRSFPRTTEEQAGFAKKSNLQ